eukprot:s2423_g23.t1
MRRRRSQSRDRSRTSQWYWILQILKEFQVRESDSWAQYKGADAVNEPQRKEMQGGGEETQPSTASLLPPKQHPAIPELQEDPTESKATGVADVQTVSTNRGAKTSKKGRA